MNSKNDAERSDAGLSSSGLWAEELDYRQGHPFANLWRWLEGDKTKIFAAMFYYAIKASPVWAMPIVTANIINFATHADRYTMRFFWFNVAVLVVVLVQNIPFHVLFIHYASLINRHLETRLRATLVSRLQQLSIGAYSNWPTGKLQSKLMRDVEAIQVLVDLMFRSFFDGVYMILFALAVTLWRQPWVAVFYVLAVPLSVLLLHLFRDRLTEGNRNFRDEIERMSARMMDMLEMIPITRAHGVEDTEINRIGRQLNEVKKKGYRLDIVNAWFGSASFVCYFLFQFLCLFVTGYLAYRGRITVGEVVMFQSFFAIIVGVVNAMLANYAHLLKGFESIHSIGEVMLCSDIERNRGKQAVASVRGEFVFDQVSLNYGSSQYPALRDFSLKVAPGESIALVGESGAGKTTIVKLIIGFHRPTLGRIFLDGADMDTLDLRQYRRFLAVVPQNTLLFNGSIRDNISYGLPEVSDKALWDAVEMANAADFIKRLPQGIDSTIGERGSQLSGGERQRIAIARALIRNPRVIIFDEATSSLDNASEAYVQEAIDRLMHGRTTFIVAHRLSTIRKANRIVVMRQGCCVEAGTHKELMSAAGEFYRLQSLQTAVYS